MTFDNQALADKKAIIFDFDGTLADSNYVWKKVDSDFFRSRGMEVPPDYVDAISTMSFYSGAVYTKERYSLKESPEEIMAEWNVHALYEYANNVKLKDYVPQYLTYLNKEGYKLGIATASNPEFYMPVLERYGLKNMFSAFADGTCGVRNKDYPDIYELCAKKLSAKAKECMVFEDILKGIMSAKEAGMCVTAVYDEHSGNWEETKKAAHFYINSFKGLVN